MMGFPSVVAGPAGPPSETSQCVRKSTAPSLAAASEESEEQAEGPEARRDEHRQQQDDERPAGAGVDVNPGGERDRQVHERLECPQPDGTARTVGDVDFGPVRERLGPAGWITPVPGGVGPVTVAMLLRNTLRSAELLLGS